MVTAPTTQEYDTLQMPPNVVGYGLAEIAWLVSVRGDSPTAAKWAEVTALGDLLDNTDFLRAGASSLVARGWLTERDETITTLGEAVPLDYLVGRTNVWLQIIAMGESNTDLAVVALAPDLVGVLQPRVMGTWFGGFNEDVDRVPELVTALTATFTQLHPDNVFAIEASTSDRELGVLLVRPLDDGQWDVVDQTIHPEADSHETLTEAELAARIRRVIG